MARIIRTIKYFFNIHFLSYKTLSILLITAMLMDYFLKPVRNYCSVHELKVSLFGFPILWNRQYVGVLLLLLFLFLISDFPLSRKQNRYFISRLGIASWCRCEAVYLFIISVVYYFYCYLLFILFLLPCGRFMDYTKGWMKFYKNIEAYSKGIIIVVPDAYISSHDTLTGNVHFFLCAFLVMCFISMVVLFLNQLNMYFGIIADSFIILSGLANKIAGRMTYFSPLHFTRLDIRYSISKPDYPSEQYIYTILILMIILFYSLAEENMCMTQENNKRRK